MAPGAGDDLRSRHSFLLKPTVPKPGSISRPQLSVSFLLLPIMSIEEDLFGTTFDYGSEFLNSQLDHLTLDDYEKHRTRVFGTSNPQLHLESEQPYWYAMIRSTLDSWNGARTLGTRLGTDLRDYESVPRYTIERFGQSRAVLPDGTVVWIAGEHEDSYDPDFMIYNDVLVIRPLPPATAKGDDTYDASGVTRPRCRPMELYGYPEDVFPPTDFHTATLVGSRIWIIGNLSYMDNRRVNETQVLVLDTATFAIEHLPTTGTIPGWLFRHNARLTRDTSEIIVSGGEVQNETTLAPLDGEYALNLATRVWRKL